MYRLRKVILKSLSVLKWGTLTLTLLNSSLLRSEDSPSAYQSHRRLGDRFYIASRLSRIFGPDGNEIIQQRIKNKVMAFGGACSPYAVVAYYDKKNKQSALLNPEYHCPNGLADSKVKPFIDGGTLREGHISKTCRELIARPNTFAHALKQAGLKESSSTSKYNKMKLFQLFYPHQKQLPQSLTKVNTDWSTLLLSLCQSGYWQVP